MSVNYVRELSGSNIGQVVKFMWKPPFVIGQKVKPETLVVGVLEGILATRKGHTLTVSPIIPNPADYEPHWDYEGVNSDARVRVKYYDDGETIESLTSTDGLNH